MLTQIPKSYWVFICILVASCLHRVCDQLKWTCLTCVQFSLLGYQAKLKFQSWVCCQIILFCLLVFSTALNQLSACFLATSICLLLSFCLLKICFQNKLNMSICFYFLQGVIWRCNHQILCRLCNRSIPVSSWQGHHIPGSQGKASYQFFGWTPLWLLLSLNSALVVYSWVKCRWKLWSLHVRHVCKSLKIQQLPDHGKSCTFFENWAFENNIQDKY